MRIEARGLLRLALLGVLASPFLLALMNVDRLGSPLDLNLAGPIVRAVTQALLSTIGALGFGLILAAGRLGWDKPARAEMLLLLPSAIPPLFLVLALVSLTSSPSGQGLVVAAHVWLGSGLAAVSIARLCEGKAAGQAEVARVLGGSRWQVLGRILWPALRADIYALALTLFALYLSSFSIPLLLGGPRPQTLEMVIYDLLARSGRWDAALLLAVAQSGLLLALGWLLPAPGLAKTNPRPLNFLVGPAWRGLVFLPSLFLLVGWLTALVDAEPKKILLGFYPALLLSLALGFAVAVTQLILFIGLAFALPHGRLTRWLTGWMGPGGAIAGLAFVRPANAAPFLALTAALAITSFPLLYRWHVRASLGALETQIQVARTLGASWSAIFGNLVWAQAGPAILRAAGLAGVWASGDYALSGLLLPGGTTIPLLARDLINHYQTGAATMIMFPFLLVAALIYGIFTNAARYVCR